MNPVNVETKTVYHITHWKAGSQWVQGVLWELQGDRVLIPSTSIADGIEFDTVEAGRIYSPLYLNRIRFEESPLAKAPHRKFLVTRDLRDTLVSWYFSLLKTHDENPVVRVHRDQLGTMNMEDGLLYLLNHQDFFGLAMISSTWLEARDILKVKFEDLVEKPESTFRRICAYCGLEVDDAQMSATLTSRSFESLAGRPRGTNGSLSHYRKGMPGDWRNHFTEAVRMEFSRQYDDLTWRCGYSPILPPGHWRKRCVSDLDD